MDTYIYMCVCMCVRVCVTAHCDDIPNVYCYCERGTIFISHGRHGTSNGLSFLVLDFEPRFWAKMMINHRFGSKSITRTFLCLLSRFLHSSWMYLLGSEGLHQCGCGPVGCGHCRHHYCNRTSSWVMTLISAISWPKMTKIHENT